MFKDETVMRTMFDFAGIELPVFDPQIPFGYQAALFTHESKTVLNTEMMYFTLVKKMLDNAYAELEPIPSPLRDDLVIRMSRTMGKSFNQLSPRKLEGCAVLFKFFSDFEQLNKMPSKFKDLHGLKRWESGSEAKNILSQHPIIDYLSSNVTKVNLASLLLESFRQCDMLWQCVPEIKKTSEHMDSMKDLYFFWSKVMCSLNQVKERVEI